MSGNGSIVPPVNGKRKRLPEVLPAPRLFSIKQAAAYLNRTPSAIRHLQHKGVLPFVNLGGRIQFDRQDLDDLIEKGKERFTY